MMIFLVCILIHDRFDTDSKVELKNSIREQIRLASIVVIIGGMYVALK